MVTINLGIVLLLMLAAHMMGYFRGAKDYKHRRKIAQLERRPWTRAYLPTNGAGYREVLLPQTALPELLALMDDAHHELKVNAYKGDWRTCNPDNLLGELYRHLDKLAAATESADLPDMKEHCADMVVLAMMLSANSGALTAPRRETPAGYPEDGDDYRGVKAA